MVRRIHRQILWTKEFQRAGTHPRVLLVKQLQSREEKWCRGKHSINESLPERQKLRHLQENHRLQRLLAENALALPCTSSRKLWWLDNSRSQCSQWRMWISKQSPIRCRGTRIGNSMDSIIPVQNKNFIRKKKRAYKSSWSRRGKPKVIHTDNSLKLGKACEDLSWNHRTSTLHRSQTKRCCWKSGTQNWGRDFCNIDAIRSGWQNGGRILCSVCAICEAFKTYCLMGRHLTNGGSCEWLKGRIISFWFDGRISSYFLPKNCRHSTNSVRKSYLEYFLGYLLYARVRIWKGDILVADIEELEKMDASQIHARTLNAKEVLTPQNGEHFECSWSQMEK